jgi:hypothetical protein
MADFCHSCPRSHQNQEMGKENHARPAYLTFSGHGIIVTVCLCSKGSAGTRGAISAPNTSSLSKVFLSLGFSDLDLLLLAAASQLFRLEGVLGLELSTTMLWDVAFGHVCGLQSGYVLILK